MVSAVLWALVLSVLFSKASTERRALLDRQDLLRTNASKQTAALGALKEEVRACNSCCLGTQAQLQAARAQLAEAQTKLIEQQGALRTLGDRAGPCPALEPSTLRSLLHGTDHGHGCPPLPNHDLLLTLAPALIWTPLTSQ